MVENGIRETNKVELNPKEGLLYAQWGLMRRYDDLPCPNSDWKQTINPKYQQYKSWLEKPREDQRISPVFGLAEKEKS